MNLRVALTLAACIGITGAAAEAEGVGIAGVRLSNDPGEYHSAGEHPFDPNQNVYLYLDLQYGDPFGYPFWAECSIVVDATGEVLRRVSISETTVYQDPVVRSSAINMYWPDAWLAITCTPRGEGTFTRTFRFSPDLWYGAPAPVYAAPAYVPPPQPQVVYVPVPAAAAPAQPAPEPTCRDTLLARGHGSFDLSYCDGVNQTCAVTLLEMGHDPFDLSYCQGIGDVGCAVTLLRGGADPFDLSSCN